MRILQLTAHFSPNVGGVETHLDDLVKALVKRKYKVFVLTYRPLETRTSWKSYESKNNLQVLRIPWVPGFFYKLLKKPIFEFFYLFPGLFIAAPFVILANNPDVIHAHGLVAGFVGVFWANAFGKRIVVSTHSIYHFPKKSLYTSFVRSVFQRADKILTLSKQSKKEVVKLGIKKEKAGAFTYWIDLKKFKKVATAKKKLSWEKKFIVLFVGRLVEEKGIPELLKAAKVWDKNITLASAGTGPLESLVTDHQSLITNFIYLGKIDNKQMPLYYSAADLVIAPSTHEEGFGRVILESLACGTPVVAANRGAIPEAMDESVGRLIDITPENIKKAVEFFYNNPDRLEKLSKDARKFAEKRYSEKNVDVIISAYKDDQT